MTELIIKKIKKYRSHIVVSFSFLLFFCVNFMAFTFADTPPNGKTGAPGEDDCTACHTGTANTGLGNISFPFPDTAWTPDSTYDLQMVLTDTSKSKFGFEMTSLDDNNDRSGTFVVTNGANSQLLNFNNRHYIAHENATSNNIWNFRWTAPNALVNGPVTFYISGNATNGNGLLTGDLVYTIPIEVPMIDITELLLVIQPQDTITEETKGASFEVGALNATGFQWQLDSGNGFQDIVDGGIYSGSNTAILFLDSVNLDMSGLKYRCQVIAGTTIISESAELTVVSFSNVDKMLHDKVFVYPNPTLDYLTVNSVNEIEQVNLFSLDGTLIISKNQSFKNINVDLTKLERGSYIIHFKSGDSNYFKNIIKK